MNNKNVELLFKYARASIKAGFDGVEFKPSRVPVELKAKHGVFVTLTINNSLRGCIGLINPVPLWQGVVKAAYSSAFEDPRFTPLSKEELEQVVIEVSILTKPVKTTLESIKHGDGVIIRKGLHSGLFLPQVWAELPDKKLFIKELFYKAGLKPGEPGVSYEKFGVQAWKERTG